MLPGRPHAMLSRQDLGEFDLSSMRTGYIGGSL